MTDGLFSFFPRIAGGFPCRAMLVGIRKQIELPRGFSTASSTLKVGAPGRGARAGPNGEDKTKILCIFCFCWCCCCHSGVGKKELVTVAGGKAHLAHTNKALVKLYPKYFVPGHIESLNQVKQASSVGEEREGLISPANTAMQVGRSF